MSHVRALPVVPVLFGCGPAANNGDANPATRSLILLHTNDEHSHFLGFGPELDDHPAATTAGAGAIHGGVGRRATVLAAERMRAMANNAAVLTVSAGDNTMGTLIEVLTATAANGGMLPARYNAATATFPRRVICSGSLCVP